MPTFNPFHATRDLSEHNHSARGAAVDQPRMVRWRARFGVAIATVLIGGLSAVTSSCGDSSTRSAAGGTKGKGGGSSKGGASNGGASDGGMDAGGMDAGGVGGASGAEAGAASTVAEGGVAGGPSGTAGQATMPEPACVMPPKWVGKIAKPIPLVSVGKPVFTNSTDTTNVGLLVDGKYKVNNGMAFKPMTATTPIWASVNVGTGYTKLLLTWRDVGNQDYGPSLYSGTDYSSATSPTGYVIKTSADSTDGDDGTWVTAATVTDNEARSRSHLLDFTGMSWVRFEATASVEVVAGTMRVVRLDELELHDMSAIGPEDYADSWFMMGDSITKMGLDRNRGANEIDKLITAQRPTYSPAIITAGNGGEKMADGLRHVETEQWLKYSEGMKFVTLAYGTNDSWGSPTPVTANFEKYLRETITILIADGRVPVLARIPWNTVGSHVTDFNAVIDRLQAEFELPCGPDLYSWFAAHQDELGSDHIHPTSTGSVSINQQYAQAILPLYPSP